MKRRWIYTPPWVDYTAQIFKAVSSASFWNWIPRRCNDWAETLLDKHCRCDQCLKREKRKQA